ncbi:hypothetical protein MVES_001282 [Malassezia vespertilionis]|uniref:[histone H3]-trimethyl-L-lysine(4) demethylase n=1 Tax=Malassezia vespertilionis TaxID=2020962 RepID=A0A2N1JEA6_9BASI|nr:hypothetical protein MVES_001282 [Malassezia vespertilionis]
MMQMCGSLDALPPRSPPRSEEPNGTASPSRRHTTRSSGAPRSPHPPPSPAKRNRAPELVSCLDIGQYIDGVEAHIAQRGMDAGGAARRSKTQPQGRTDSGVPTPPHAQLHPTRKARAKVRVPPLVYDTVEPACVRDGAPAPIATAATTPRHPVRTTSRVFALPEAPVFYPTWDEFQDPLQYIEWTARASGGNAAACGLAKIVPPEGWCMDFVVDEQQFRFRTRVQRLSELSAEGRVAQNYREQLEQFHAQQGQGKVGVPYIAGAPIDFYALKLAAARAAPHWDRIATALGCPADAAPTLKQAYESLVAPFELFLRDTKHGMPRRGASKLNACAACDTQDARGTVQCAECEKRFHLACHTPPLGKAPRRRWVCAACLVNTDFGFEDGETHSLHSFWQRCASFQQLWAQRAARRAPQDADAWLRLFTRRNTDATVLQDEDLVEAEFWRLVHTTQELVDVEYGADVHSTVHGSASPTMERHALNPYARSGWNLNNMPIAPASLLRYIKSEISGMTAPWIYIGMMFSAFCWHNEDHYTYSINYQHVGATKTWYGVPGEDAEKFEAAMQRIAPELFDSNPDLLLQLVTMMSPELAVAEGVRVYAVNQRPNEFVVTYPKGYHAGFNHGFNVNEAVNFALPNWAMDGLACARRYQQFARQPVFSHDELLVTVALHSTNLHTALWLHAPFREMVSRELEGRATVRALICAARDAKDELAPHDRLEHEAQCAHCKALCYLSQVVGDAGQVACLQHAAAVLGEDAACWHLRLRIADDALESQAAKIAERAAVPRSWQQRVRKFLCQHPRPPLRTLVALVQEGDRIAAQEEKTTPLAELASLHGFLQRAMPIVEQAQQFLSRRHGKRAEVPVRARRSAHKKDSPTQEAPVLNADRSKAALFALWAHVPQLPFEAPELLALESVVEQVSAFERSAARFLDTDAEARDAQKRVDDAERTAAQGALLHVHLPQVEALRRWVAHVKWFVELRGIQGTFLSMEDVQELLHEGASSGIPTDHAKMHELRARLERGDAWAARAAALLDAPEITRAAVDALLGVDVDVAMPERVRASVRSLQHKAAQWHALAADLYSDTAVSRLDEARELLEGAHAARVPIPYAHELGQGIALHDRWEDEVGAILRKYMRAKPKDEPASLARAFCERTIRTASAAKLAVFEAQLGGSQEKPGLLEVVAVAPCICCEKLHPRTDTVQCDECGTRFHNKCVDARCRKGALYVCPLCDAKALQPLAKKRHDVSQLPLVALLQNPVFQRDKFRFLPSTYSALQAAVRATVEFGVAVTTRIRSGALPKELLDKGGVAQVTPLLREVLRRALGCPVDVLLIADATPNPHVPCVLEALLPAFGVLEDGPGPLAKRAAPGKRLRRARLVLREDRAPVSDRIANIHCFCGIADTDQMTHACIWIEAPLPPGERLVCPLCTVRMRRKYPYAEVRVLDLTEPGPDDAAQHRFVDVHASLQSHTRPVVRTQPWAGPRRVLLHLVQFVPAEKEGELGAAPKRARLEPPPPPSPPTAQLRLPLSDLMYRGVTKSMMERHSIGWNGRALVYYSPHGPVIELGATIELDEDDMDGTKLIHAKIAAQHPASVHTTQREPCAASIASPPQPLGMPLHETPRQQAVPLQTIAAPPGRPPGQLAAHAPLLQEPMPQPRTSTLDPYTAPLGAPMLRPPPFEMRRMPRPDMPPSYCPPLCQELPMFAREPHGMAFAPLRAPPSDARPRAPHGDLAHASFSTWHP